MYIIIYKIDKQCKFDVWSREPKANALGQPRGIGWGERWKRGSGWGDTCVPVADSCWCMAKTTTILWSNYSPVKIKESAYKIFMWSEFVFLFLNIFQRVPPFMSVLELISGATYLRIQILELYEKGFRTMWKSDGWLQP